MIRSLLPGVIILGGFIQFAHADEKKTMSIIECEPTHIYTCSLNKDKCEQVKVVNVDGVHYFEIDSDKNTMIGKIGEVQIDIANITNRHGNENTYIFFGTHADSKFDWVLRIDKKSKKMILLATNEMLESFTVYGTCKWEMEK